jgi:hypothetical protein
MAGPPVPATARGKRSRSVVPLAAHARHAREQRIARHLARHRAGIELENEAMLR